MLLPVGESPEDRTPTLCCEEHLLILDNYPPLEIIVMMIAYSIFSLYRNTKIIHSIMMIWLVNFIVSNYKLASGPPQDPGGVKNIFSKSKDIDS